MRVAYAGVKRTIDVAGSVLIISLSAPVLVGLAMTVRWRLGSPVLFRQRRPGLHGEPFTLYKFRTMKEAYDAAGQSLPDGDRLTPFGRLLRKTSLDELPTLFNVLRGDMSLVGPRPLLMEYLPLYTPEQARRHEVKPGITGWAQVNGRNAITWDEKFRHDLWYVENASLRIDTKVLLSTLRGVVARHGISQPGHVTAEKFRGSAAR